VLLEVLAGWGVSLQRSLASPLDMSVVCRTVRVGYTSHHATSHKGRLSIIMETFHFRHRCNSPKYSNQPSQDDE
jgi:hypothetical protein